MEIALSNGEIALIDDEDYPLVSTYRWAASRGPDGKPYATARIQHGRGKERFYTTLRMHRLIMEAERGEEIDHINMNTLDNRRANLRKATKAQNMANRNRTARSTSGWKGVHFHKGAGNWMAEIKAEGTRFYLGLFDRCELAGLAYDCASRVVHGEFCRPNFPDVTEYPFTFEEITAQYKASLRSRGVYFERCTGKWVAKIQRNRKTFWFGRYETREEARAAWIEGVQMVCAHRADGRAMRV